MDHDAGLDAILDQVEAAGLVEQYVDEQGRMALRLTPDGVRVGRQLAMLGEVGQDDPMAALLGPGDTEEPQSAPKYSVTKTRPAPPAGPVRPR